MNSIILARRGSALVLEAAERAMDNLHHHRLTQGDGFAPYHIGGLCGPRLLSSVLLEPHDNRTVRADYSGAIKVISEDDAPFERNAMRAYRQHGKHWSARQKREALFHR